MSTSIPTRVACFCPYTAHILAKLQEHRLQRCAQALPVLTGYCGTLQGSVQAAMPAARRNFCEIFAVDLAYLGDEGLMTDR